jgi:hypothetical protein
LGGGKVEEGGRGGDRERGEQARWSERGKREVERESEIGGRVIGMQ